VSGDRTFAIPELSPSVAAAAAAAKAQGQPLRLVVTTVVSLEVRISHIGRDYVAGDLDTSEGVSVIIPGMSIVVVDSDGLHGACTEAATNPPARSQFLAMATNSQRLSHRVIVHTAVGTYAGAITGVTRDAIVVSSCSTHQRLVLSSHIVWISVLGH
jgi:hypothetical protein